MRCMHFIKIKDDLAAQWVGGTTSILLTCVLAIAFVVFSSRSLASWLRSWPSVHIFSSHYCCQEHAWSLTPPTIGSKLDVGNNGSGLERGEGGGSAGWEMRWCCCWDEVVKLLRWCRSLVHAMPWWSRFLQKWSIVYPPCIEPSRDALRYILYMEKNKQDRHPFYGWYLIKKHVFEWYLIWCGSKNGYHEDIWLKEIGPRS